MAKLLQIVVRLLSAICVMLWHETAKLLAYRLCTGKKYTGRLKIWYFIDPIGLIFMLTNYAGFSKPAPIRVQDRKTNIWLGMAGFISLLVLYGFGIYMLRTCYGGLDGIRAGSSSHIWNLTCIFLQCLCIHSIGMLFVNLFPVSVFDLGEMIAGMHPEKYMELLQSDALYKTFVGMFIVLDLFHYVSLWVTQLCLCAT